MPASENHSLNPRRDGGRRNFVCTVLASGFAAVVLPVGARAVRTDCTRRAVGEVPIPVAA